MEQEQDYIKMDYSIESPVERTELVEKIIASTPPERLTSSYLEKLADYIIYSMDKEERKTKKILTDNHMVTVNARETSFEGLVGKLENGEDGIYNLIANDKNIIFKPKIEITAADIEEIPGLKELRAAIETVDAESKIATGKRAFFLKKQLIEMRKDQYVLKDAYRKPMYCANLVKSIARLDLRENITITEKGEIISDGAVSLLNSFHVSVLLCNYSKIKEDCNIL